jgi:hypothetical protein
MSCVLSLPRELLFLIAYYLLPKDQQNKLVFRYSHDWRNFINTSKEYFLEWKKQTQVIVLESKYALKFIRSMLFFHRMKMEVVNSLHQIELHVVGCLFEEDELRTIDCAKSFSAYRSAFEKLPQVVSHLSLDECHIDDLSRHSDITSLRLNFCNIGLDDPQKTVDVKTLPITEEAVVSNMELQNYHCLILW